MPKKSRLENILFTLVMAFVMVYAMVCYNIAIDKGGMTNEVFLLAFHEIPIMWPIACILEYFVVEKLATMLAFRLVNPKEDKPVFVTLAICSMIVCLMLSDVSGNESDCHSFVCTSGKSGDRSVAAKICIKLPNGIMLADLFWRSICKKLIYMGEKSDSS